MARRSPRLKASAPIAGSPWRYAVAGGVVWVIAFAAYFFGQTLQNNSQVARIDLLLLLPDLLLANFFPGDDAPPSGWRYLPQRLDLITTAALIAAGAWGLGGLSLRLINRSAPEAPAFWLCRSERIVVTFGIGLAAWSLLTLLFGVFGWLARPLFIVVLLASIAGELVLLVRERSSREPKHPGCLEQPGCWFVTLVVVAMAPFLLAAALGSMLPPFDFDVKEYHLGGPKEWYLDGRVHFLPHNVYTSFPSLTEMLSLSAMVVRSDWYRGALSGQLLLAGFLPLTTLTVFATTRRLFGTPAGLIGAFIYATIPWSYRIAVVAYAEGGLTCYVALSLLAAVITLERVRAGQSPVHLVLLTGLFAGSAMACKYTGVVQAVIPIGVALLGATLWRAGGVSPPSTLIDLRANDLGRPTPPARLIRIGLIYTLGVLLAVGPWLVKNTIETGNPVYPLLWNVFDGRDWNAESNAKWKAAHSPAHYEPSSFFREIGSVAAQNDWQSVLVFAFAPLALLGSNRRAAGWVWLYVGFLYVSWWVLTHRIDRFWVPLLPVASVVAGAGAAWADDLLRRIGDVERALALRRPWRIFAGSVLVLGALFNLGVITTPLAGNPSFLADLDAAAKTVETPHLALLNEMLPPNAKVLLVGEAEIFDARFPVVYNTVFDRNIFEEWTASPQRRVPADEWPLRPTNEIRSVLSERGITHIYVNWREILRYRTTYGFTPFVTPARFTELRDSGVLRQPTVLRTTPLVGINNAVRREAASRFRTLIRGRGDERFLIAAELYPVKQSDE